MGNQLSQFPKEDFLELLRSGMTEPKALASLKLKSPIYIMLLTRDSEFKEAIAEAKRIRADVWYEKIVDSVDDALEKDQVAAAKLRLDTLKYLASVDNPDKYSEKVKHQHDINVNIFQEIKDLPAAEAKRLISTSDPFSVDAEFKEIVEVEGDEWEDLL